MDFVREMGQDLQYLYGDIKEDSIRMGRCDSQMDLLLNNTSIHSCIILLKCLRTLGHKFQYDLIHLNHVYIAAQKHSKHTDKVLYNGVNYTGRKSNVKPVGAAERPGTTKQTPNHELW